MEMRIIIPKTSCGCLICPNCGQHEVNCKEQNQDKRRFFIKAFKVDDSSHCLNCNSWFDSKGNFIRNSKQIIIPYAIIEETNRISNILFQKDWDKLHFEEKEAVNKTLWELGE